MWFISEFKESKEPCMDHYTQQGMRKANTGFSEHSEWAAPGDNTWMRDEDGRKKPQ